MNTNFEMQNLLNGGLPLDKVGPHLRYAARKAAHSGDPQRMRAVARVIMMELLRRGELIQMPSGLQVNDAKLVPAGIAGQFDFDHMLRAMMVAQDMNVGNPGSGEAGIVLESVLVLLQQFAPQFGLHILLFDETALSEPRDRVFGLDPQSNPAHWLGQRPAGQSAYIPTVGELPANITFSRQNCAEFSAAVAVPIFEPAEAGEEITKAQEVGLLFLLARNDWSQDAALRLGAKLSRFVTHRWRVHRELDNQIHVDALTGLFNRRFFNGHFPLLLERAKRNQSPLSLIVADIDLFKNINTDYGLLIGDQVLQMVAQRLQELVRRVDVVCRRGGEEFAIILPEAGFDAAREVITRLLNAPFTTVVQHDGQTTEIRVRLSYGVTTFPDNGSNDVQLHHQAESTMFISKDSGRNQCHFWRNDGDHLLQRPK